MGTQCYNAHSFRNGVATTARKANIPDMIIKMLGRWKSDAYQSYIKTPLQKLLNCVPFRETKEA